MPNRLPMNLQLFAGVNADGVDPEDLGDDVPDVDPPEDKKDDDASDDDVRDLEVDFSDEDDDTDFEEEEDESDEDEADPVDPKKPPAESDKKPKDNPTAAAVIAERRKWQEKLKELEAKGALADKILKQSGAASIDELNQRMDFLETERLKKEGVDPQVAAAFVAQQRQLTEMQSTLRKQKYDGEAERLKQDAFFADLDDHRDEFEAIAEKTGMTLEEVYMAKRGSQRMKEREAEIEARVKANRDKRDGKRVNTNPSAGAGKQSGKSYNLTPEQLAAAKHGVKKGHFKSIEEYAKLL